MTQRIIASTLHLVLKGYNNSIKNNNNKLQKRVAKWKKVCGLQ